jgi:hypothetical protein
MCIGRLSKRNLLGICLTDSDPHCTRRATKDGRVFPMSLQPKSHGLIVGNPPSNRPGIAQRRNGRYSSI